MISHQIFFYLCICIGAFPIPSEPFTFLKKTTKQANTHILVLFSFNFCFRGLLLLLKVACCFSGILAEIKKISNDSEM